MAVALALGLATGTAAAPAAPPAFISAAEVHRLMVQGAPPVLIDVRSRAEYQARHIRGAVSIPLPEVVQRAREIPRDRLVVLY